jgi:hypothetical protein
VQDAKTSGAGLNVQSAQSFAYSPALCFNSLAMTAPVTSSVHSYAGDLTFTYTQQCLDLVDVYYCTAIPTATCSSNPYCTKITSSYAGQSMIDSTIDKHYLSYIQSTNSGTRTTGPQYACVADNANTAIYAYSGAYCVQTFAITGITSTYGTSSSYTYAFSAGTAVSTLTVAFDKKCSTIQSLYACSAYDLTQTCSSSSSCTLLGATISTSATTYSIAATSMATGKR